MEPIIVLILFSGAMLIGCYLAGSIPLAVSMSEDRMEVVSVLGAGLLIGTALSVIIPEGVNALIISNQYEASKGASTLSTKSDAHHHTESNGIELHSIIGISLVLGFLLMLLIDQIAGSHHHPDAESSSVRSGKPAWMATLGLVVHAAADGIALGAAVASSHTEVEVIIFFAIMLHKAPAAFGLVTFLLHENLETRRIRRHLLLFSIAAPIGAFVTYFAITQSGSKSLSSTKSAGTAMLFSAGTFLYVSTVHVLPELTQRNADNTSKKFSRKQLLALICGSLLPLVLTFGHHH